MRKVTTKNLRNYVALAPNPAETKAEYCRRLEGYGHEETFIRKALAHHFSMQLEEMSGFFTDFELARLRHIKLICDIAPNRTEYSLMKKVAKNLGLTDVTAREWIERFHREDSKNLEYL